MAKIDPHEPCPCGSGKTFAECHGPKMKARAPAKITERIRLVVIPEPDPGTRPVFTHGPGDTVFFTGTGTEVSLDCGNCGASLVVGMEREQINGLVLKCSNCGCFNDTLIHS